MVLCEHRKVPDAELMIMNTNVNGAVCINGPETSSSTSSHTNSASRRGRVVLCERRKVPDAEMSMDGGLNAAVSRASVQSWGGDGGGNHRSAAPAPEVSCNLFSPHHCDHCS